MMLPGGYSLDVPGARLYYEVQGSGPVIMLVGHPMGASGFAAIAPLLAEHHTVVTHDPRGFGRSTIDDRDQDAEPDLVADDARRVLEAVGGGPVHVFGSSGGAVTGLALVARYPDLVQTLVAHEAPLALLLPDAEEARADIEGIYDAVPRNSGIGAAWQRFSGFAGFETHSPDDEPAPRPSAEIAAANQRFFAHGLLPIARIQARPGCPTGRNYAGYRRRWDHLEWSVCLAHGRRPCRSSQYATSRFPRGTRWFRERCQGVRQGPPPRSRITYRGARGGTMRLQSFELCNVPESALRRLFSPFERCVVLRTIRLDVRFQTLKCE